MSGRGERWINGVWYGGSRWYLLLLPLSALFWMITHVRRALYRWGWLRTVRLEVPLIIVGNLSIGGTGKTPLTGLLTQELQRRGWSPGIVSRGYGGRVGPVPIAVNAESDPAIVGDEPLLLARHTGCPVVVHPDRVAAARFLQKQGVDVIVADDGLQHYELARDMEIAVVDGKRLWGNGHLLPAGPLRESLARLRSVQHVVVQSASDEPAVPGLSPTVPVSTFSLQPLGVHRLDETETRSLDDFNGQRVHGVAAIGNPERFFDTLEAAGVDVARHPYPDHATLGLAELGFDENLDVIMTEKDAVKCHSVALKNLWYLRVEASIHSSNGISLIDNVEATIKKS